jgi:cobalamin-dependent methionine synthase I
MNRVLARLAAVTVLAALVLGAAGATDASATDIRIVYDRGTVKFEDWGEHIEAIDTLADGYGIRAYLSWKPDHTAAVHDAGADMEPARRNLSIPENRKVWLTMCYTRNGANVKCSKAKAGRA